VIRKILVPVRGDGKGENVLAHATLLANRFDAHIEVTHCRPKPSDMLPFGVPVPGFLQEQILQQAGSVADAVEKDLRAAFDRYAQEHALKVVDKQDGPGPSASWVEEEGKQIDIIKHHGRLADLIVVAKPDRDRNLGTNTLKAALFGTGRPVMMCPPRDSEPGVLGDRVAIAWNGSVEAVRAVSLTHDLLARASAVTILTADRSELHSAGADDLAHYLAQRGIEASVDQFPSRGKIGVELLERAGAAAADILVMGAYGDSHEHETLFGGNTQVIVDKATIPVVMVH